MGLAPRPKSGADLQECRIAALHAAVVSQGPYTTLKDDVDNGDVLQNAYLVAVVRRASIFEKWLVREDSEPDTEA